MSVSRCGRLRQPVSRKESPGTGPGRGKKVVRYSTRTRYGLRFLVNLASRPEGACVQLAEIAREEGISAKYLEQIVRTLRPSGILKSSRGARGGYALARPASEIFMDEVFGYLEGHTAPVECLCAGSSCSRKRACSTREFWMEMDRQIRIFLACVPLARFVEQGKNSRAIGEYRAAETRPL